MIKFYEYFYCEVFDVYFSPKHMRIFFSVPLILLSFLNYYLLQLLLKGRRLEPDKPGLDRKTADHGGKQEGELRVTAGEKGIILSILYFSDLLFFIINIP